MGETGCGLVDASAIIGGTPLATKWQEVEAVCPWFFLLRDLCGAGRPNVSESARANSTTELDVNLLRSRRGRNRDDESSEEEEPFNGEDQDDEDDGEAGDDEDKEDNEDEDDEEWMSVAEETRRHSSPTVTQAPAPRTPAATQRSQSQRKRQSSPAPERLPKKQKEKRTITVSNSG
jgi:glucan-binding YG repeat protein